MSSDQVTAALAVLAMAGAAGLIGLAGALAGPTLRVRVLRYLSGQGVPVAWLVATVATVGSLYLSEGAHFPPCRLCWFQRIAMYPLVVVLAAAWRWRDVSARMAALGLAGLGLGVNLWHVAVEIRPSLEGGSCDPSNPCSIRWVEQFGFWTIPRMATVAFLLVLALVALDRPSPRPRSDGGDAPPGALMDEDGRS